ncbi:hypothetical protein [Paludibaculum fermentans]|uniref:hypothetical protein n=1 Tax=Paludibaculum fermentans TaxID=1473598 RepID=UPI003EBB8DE0
MKTTWCLTLAVFAALVFAPLSVAKEKTPAQRRAASKPPTIQQGMKERKRQMKRDKRSMRQLEAFRSRPKVRL